MGDKSAGPQRTAIITAGLLAFVLGMGLVRVPGGSAWLFMSVLSFAALLTIRKLAVLSIFMVSGLALGYARGATFLPRLAPYTAAQFKNSTVQVRAASDAVYNDKKQLTFDADHVHMHHPQVASLPGKIRVSGFGETAVYRGDVVRVTGRLYPGRGSQQGFMSFAKVQVVSRDASVLERWRRAFVAGMQTALPEPQASFGLGLLVGQRSTLPESVAAALSAVGLTHIIAVSGYNLTILVRFVRRMGRNRSKYQITVASLVLIVAFLLVTGLSASIVRAALVSVLSLWAWYYGRQFRPVLLLALVAAVTAAWNPLYVWGDVGWFLSFLAFFGVMVLAPLCVRRIHGAKRPNPFLVLVYESLAAQAMALPLILFVFQELSLVAIFSNVLVVPLVPVAMAGALLAGLAGMFVPAFAGLFALPARLLLTYMLDVVQTFARIPHAVVTFTLSLQGLVIIYGSLLALSLLLKKTTEVKHATLPQDEDIL
jgi:competence protein ComEC